MTSLAPLFTNTASDTDNDPLQNALIDLWNKIEKKQKRNQKYLRDKENLFAEFQTKILPLEQQQGKRMAEMLEFLIPFLSRKSLSEYQREELVHWIESMFEVLRSHPFLTDVDYEALESKFNQSLHGYLESQNIEVDQQQIEQVHREVELMFGGDMQLTDEEIIALLKDPSLINQYIQRMHEALDEEDAAAADTEHNSNKDHHEPFEDFFEDDFTQDNTHYHASQNARQKSLDKLFKAGQLNKMYKRLASLLHPDKELDPVKKAQKHGIMQTLSEARKNKDAFTLLQLYQTHIHDGEFGFDTDTLSSMQTLLTEKLHQLDNELYHAKSNNELSSLVWRKFSGRSKKQTENNFASHIAYLEEDIYQKQVVMQRYQTVAEMKKFLQERVELNRGWSNEMPIDLMDLFR